MKNSFSFTNILIALDLSPMDYKLIAYCRFILENSGAKRLRFIHVIPQFILPGITTLSFSERMENDESIEEAIHNKLAQEIHPSFNDLVNVEIEIEVLTGTPQKILLQEAKRSKPDLLILGKKTISDNSGIIARRIARKTDCAVCFVTENTFPKARKIMVPIDFSTGSVNALKAALQLQKYLKDVAVTTFHAISMPATAYNINKNFHVNADMLKISARTTYDHFLKKHFPDYADIPLKMVYNEHLDAAKHIVEEAANNETDLLIVGAKGHSLGSDIIFGSVTEKLVNYESKIPVLIIR